MLDVSKKMLTESSRNPVVATVEKEAGWLLLSSLLGSMPKEVGTSSAYIHVFTAIYLFLSPNCI